MKAGTDPSIREGGRDVFRAGQGARAPRAVLFKQVDLTRAVKGVEAAGMRVGRVEIEQSGKIVILSDRIASEPERNPWDDE